MPNWVHQTAFVLHSRPYRESSALVTFFSHDKGKFNGIVNGVRGTKSAKRMNKSAMLQPFQMLEISWHAINPSQELVKVRELEHSGMNFPLSGTANLCGLYANELLYRLLFPCNETLAVFEAYQTLLYGLLKSQEQTSDHAKSEIEWALRQFEYQLLSDLVAGFSVEEFAELQLQSHYQFLTDFGWQKAPQGVSGECLLKLQQRNFCQSCLPAWKAMMRQMIDQQLNGKPLISRKLFSQK